MKPLISLLLTLVFAVTLFAQKEDVTVETDLPPTLVRAEKLPLPEYPEAAKNAGRSKVERAAFFTAIRRPDEANGP